MHLRKGVCSRQLGIGLELGSRQLGSAAEHPESADSFCEASASTTACSSFLIRKKRRTLRWVTNHTRNILHLYKHSNVPGSNPRINQNQNHIKTPKPICVSQMWCVGAHASDTSSKKAEQKITACLRPAWSTQKAQDCLVYIESPGEQELHRQNLPRKQLQFRTNFLNMCSALMHLKHSRQYS